MHLYINLDGKHLRSFLKKLKSGSGNIKTLMKHILVQSSSPVLLVTRFVQVFHGHKPLNLELLKAILKHLKTFLNVLIFKLQCYRERLLLSPLI